MKDIPDALQAHLDSGATTLCWCWKIIRKDGIVFGFTDHDRDVAFDGTTYEGESGLNASEARNLVGLAVGGQTVDGALSSDRLASRDLSAGLYDDAKVELYRVNWEAPSQRILFRSGSIGEVTRTSHGFSAELRGLAHYLQQERGRAFLYACDAILGDDRCGVDVTQPPFRASATIANVISPLSFLVSGLDGFASGWFTHGLLVIGAGGPGETALPVNRHTRAGGAVRIDLWQDTVQDIAVGLAVELVAGCDRQFATCKSKFANVVNYRGFPHIPGQDFVIRYPNRNDGTGGSEGIQS